MITIREVIGKSTDFLSDKNVPNARREAEEVVANSLKRPRIDLYMHFDQPLEEAELQLIRQNLSRRAKREPLQYIMGEVPFFDARIKVGPDVLIPRVETEILVDQIAKKLEKEAHEGKVLWDLCCGSGCIGISLKKRFPLLRVILSDISQKALNLAKKNAEMNHCDVEFYEGDLFEAFSDPVDYLVCNPPYISEDEYRDLEPEVKTHEPKISLVSGATGLECYERIAKELKNNLKKEGKLWLEIGSTQGSPVQEMFYHKTNLKGELTRDYSGQMRFFFLELE